MMNVRNMQCLSPDEATTLFRATTLASTLMEQYMKATATPFVHHALKDTILKIMESKQSCEVRVLTVLGFCFCWLSELTNII